MPTLPSRRSHCRWLFSLPGINAYRGAFNYFIRAAEPRRKMNTPPAYRRHRHRRYLPKAARSLGFGFPATVTETCGECLHHRRFNIQATVTDKNSRGRQHASLRLAHLPSYYYEFRDAAPALRTHKFLVAASYARSLFRSRAPKRGQTRRARADGRSSYRYRGRAERAPRYQFIFIDITMIFCKPLLAF